MSELSRCWYVHIMYQCYFTRFQHYEVVPFQINFITDFFCVVSIEIKRYLSSLRKIIRLLIARLSWHLLRVSFAGFQRSVGFECLDGHNWLISESVTRIKKNREIQRGNEHAIQNKQYGTTQSARVLIKTAIVDFLVIALSHSLVIVCRYSVCIFVAIHYFKHYFISSNSNTACSYQFVTGRLHQTFFFCDAWLPGFSHRIFHILLPCLISCL